MLVTVERHFNPPIWTSERGKGGRVEGMSDKTSATLKIPSSSAKSIP